LKMSQKIYHVIIFLSTRDRARFIPKNPIKPISTIKCCNSYYS
jgi:hypothetical protein